MGNVVSVHGGSLDILEVVDVWKERKWWCILKLNGHTLFLLLNFTVSLPELRGRRKFLGSGLESLQMWGILWVDPDP